MASITQSRFALLKVEGEDDGRQKQKKHQNKESEQKNSQKSKKKKKNKQDELQLKQMAFGSAKGSRNRVQSAGTDHGVGGEQTSNGPEKGQQWDEWQKLDSEFTKDTFEKDLQQALLLSKLELEAGKQKKKNSPEGNSVPTSATIGAGDSKESKKKKKKEKANKPNTMSLEEFNQKLDDKKTHSDDLESVVSPITPALSKSEMDPKFFQNVDNDVSRILRQEKMQEEYKKQYAAESVITARYVEEAKKKDKEIEFLRATLKKQEEELKQVKKRNKQLCVILAQGEMKDKSEVLMQVEELSNVRDELTEQVSELTAELEKERSKVHQLRTELDKHNKSGKHK